MTFSKTQLVVGAGIITLLLAWLSAEPGDSTRSLPIRERNAQDSTNSQPSPTAPQAVSVQALDATPSLTNNDVVELKTPRVEEFCPQFVAWKDNEKARDNSDSALKSHLVTALDALSTSSLAEHLTVAALMRPETEAEDAIRVELISQAIEKDPRNPFHYWHGVNACNRSPTPAGCPNIAWENALVELDRQNSASWMAVATSRFARDDESGAFEAVEQAGAAAQSNIYWTDAIRISDVSLEAAGVSSPLLRTSMALNVASSSAPSYFRHTKMCSQQSAKSTEWAQACLQYGERVSEQSGIVLDSQIALAIQSQSLKALGDIEGSERLDDRRTQLKAEFLVATKLDYDELQAISFGVPDLFQDYLETLDAHGELAALTWQKTRLAEYIRNNPNQACTALLEIYAVIEQFQ